MNSSLVNADRVTHLRIVAVALIAGIVVAAIGTFAARNENEKAANFYGGGMASKATRIVIDAAAPLNQRTPFNWER
jgi:hypothetical protein